MASLTALFVMLISIIFPTIQTKATVDGEHLRLVFDPAVTTSAYKAEMDYRLFASLRMKGIVKVAPALGGSKATFTDVTVTAAKPEAVKTTTMVLKLDDRLRIKSDDGTPMPLDLMGFFGQRQLVLPLGKDVAFSFDTKGMKVAGKSKFTGVKDGVATVETTATITVEKAAMEVRHVVRFSTDGGSLLDANVNLKAGNERAGCSWKVERAN